MHQYRDQRPQPHQALGVRAFMRFVRDTYSGPWLDGDRVDQCMKRPFQLRFT